jgi:hypothetical protein
MHDTDETQPGAEPGNPDAICWRADVSRADDRLMTAEELDRLDAERGVPDGERAANWLDLEGLPAGDEKGGAA